MRLPTATLPKSFISARTSRCKGAIKMALITVNIIDEALEVLENYAEKKDISVSEFIRRAVLEKLEDLEDIQAADAA
ncbi:MAG: ribbon-helix-helix protein, CopG family, partial [Selenomonadaceae bacterium]|nr:ribbon-helix-helix protein, CopG family [Selenomonadaceae bacterium]